MKILCTAPPWPSWGTPTRRRTRCRTPSCAISARERAWLLKVTVNGCKSRLRSPWRRRTAPLLDTYPAADREERELLEAIQALPPKDRAVILKGELE